MMRTPHWAIEQYDRGNLTEGEKFLLLTQAITEKNVQRFVASVSPEQLRGLKTYIDSCPNADEDWSKLRSFHIGCYVGGRSAEEVEAERVEENRLHRRGVEILRDVIGPQVVVAPELLAWRGGTIPKLARAIYDGRRWEDLPVLADALEEAGFNDEEMVNHCRQQGMVHVRGCWLLGLLLGKR
jgi:hypothetical protein